MGFPRLVRSRFVQAAFLSCWMALAFSDAASGQPVDVDLAVLNDWGSGFTAEVKITNLASSPVNGWLLVLDLPATINNLWNGTYTQSGTHLMVRNAEWNGVIPPSGAVAFGFVASYSGSPPTITTCIFNGQSCPSGEPPPPPPPPGPTGLTVNWNVRDDWGSGYVADATIQNSSSAAIDGWTLEFDLGGQVVNIWNGQLTSSGQHRTVTNASWNGVIPAGGSAGFGLQGQYSGARPSPTNCVLNGAACTFSGGDPPPPADPLSIRLTSPLGGAIVSGDVAVVAEATGDGVTGVEFFVDGASLGQDLSSPYSISWDTTTVADGPHTLSAAAATADESATSDPVTVTVRQSTPPPPPTGAEGFLSVSGSQLVDSEGEPVRLTGVNWFGFETNERVVHGLWTRDYRSMLHQIRDLGFNVIRLPWSNAILEPGATPGSIAFGGTDAYDGRSPINQPLQGRSSLEALDLIIEEAGTLGLKIILDNHSRRPGGYLNEDLWYTPDFSEQRWINDWVTLAERYRDNPTVVGFDLNNEPHGRATWGSGDASTDWAAAAERAAAAIHAAHPDVLIIVEGIEAYNNNYYWWGGNLRGARDRPLTGITPSKLVYSAHDYGPEVYGQPWFFEGSFPSNLAPLWDATWGYIQQENRGHTLIGEFGIQSQTSFEGRSLTWFQTLLAYMGDSHSWTFWAWNPNSGDTGGILQDDWVSVNQWKLDLLTPHLAPQFLPAE